MQGVKFSHTVNELESINASHNLAPMDLTKGFTADLAAVIAPGVLLKRAVDNVATAGPGVITVTGGAAGPLVATGILATDRLVRVYNETDNVDLTAEFTITADDEIDNTGGTATTAKVLTVTFERERAQSGDYQPWIQGTDSVDLIAGVYAGASNLDTTIDEIGLVRVFGPIRANKLTAWTAASGATTAAASAASITALEAMNIYAL